MISVLMRSFANRSMLRTASSLVLRGSLRTRTVVAYFMSEAPSVGSSSLSESSDEEAFSSAFLSPMGERV